VTSTAFVGALTGNADTATALATTRTINGVNFNGTANITVTATATNTLTISSPLTGTSYNGSAAVSIGLGTVGVANGGTGLTATPSNGQLAIGNGTAYTLATLTAGSAISITNGAGSVQFNTVANIYPYASKTIVFNVLSITDNTTVKASATATQNAVTYAVTASTNSAIEGGTVSYTITSTGVPVGTTLYWTNGGTAPAADFSDNTNSGTVVVTST
jgi:hypothetical protein